MRILRPFILLGLAWIGLACQSNTKTDKEDPGSLNMPQPEAFQQTLEGTPASLYLMEHPAGIKTAITNYGGRIVSLWVKDKTGEWTDIVLGFDSLVQFQKVKERYYGATIGRYGNRIANGIFELDGQSYQLPKNNGPNTLHGGPKGFHEQVWQATALGDTALQLSYTSPDGEMGFPGTVTAKVTFTLTADPGLLIEYEAQTDQPTVLNLTNHAFYNLNGEGSGTINDHLLMIAAESYTPVDSTLIPTGEIASVAGTPFDFREPITIGARVETDNQQLAYGKGYDHNFVITPAFTDSLHLSAYAIGDKSGIQMNIYTQEPGLQFYGGNFMDGSHQGKSGNPYSFRTAFCLETQHFPDSPNQPGFPPTLLQPDQVYQTKTLHTFSVVK